MLGETFKFASSFDKTKEDIQNNGYTRKIMCVMDEVSNSLSNAEKEITSSVETGYKSQSSYAAKRIMSADSQHVKKRFKKMGAIPTSCQPDKPKLDEEIVLPRR